MEKMTVAEVEKVCKKELSNKFNDLFICTSWDSFLGDLVEIYQNSVESMIDIIPTNEGFTVLYFEDNTQENAKQEKLETIKQVIELCTKLFEK